GLRSECCSRGLLERGSPRRAASLVRYSSRTRYPCRPPRGPAVVCLLRPARDARRLCARCRGTIREWFQDASRDSRRVGGTARLRRADDLAQLRRASRPAPTRVSGLRLGARAPSQFVSALV